MPLQFSLLAAKLAVLAATTAIPSDHQPGDKPAARNERRPVLDKKQFARVRAAMPEAAFSYFLYCHLLDVEFHLEEIVRAWAARNFARVSQKARVLAGMTADLGASRASAAATRLEKACHTGDYPQTSPLIGELGECCTECEMELRRFLAYRARLAGAA